MSVQHGKWNTRWVGARILAGLILCAACLQHGVSEVLQTAPAPSKDKQKTFSATTSSTPEQKVGAARLTVIVAGDVEWSGGDLSDSGSVVYDTQGKTLLEGGWQPIPRLITPDVVKRLQDRGDPLLHRMAQESEQLYGASSAHIETNYKYLKTHGLKFGSTQEWARHPFRRIAPVLREADVAFVNLETPLSDRAYRVGTFLTPAAFARGLSWAGIDVVATANNHAMDAERQGMFDTLEALRGAGIRAAIGSGENLDAARAPAIFEHDGIRVAFLAYTQYENSGTLGFATPTRAGVAPLDPALIAEDIRRARARADHVVLSFHWDIYHFDVSRSHELHPGAVEFARAMIDAGADAIVGHHPHVVRAVELYKGRPILYSMGNLIFSFGLPQWGDNYVARLEFSKDAVERVELLPVAGRGIELAQPYLLQGERARAVLDQLRALSAHLGTTIDSAGDVGILRPGQSPAVQ